MERQIFTVVENNKIAKDVFLMTLAGDTKAMSSPGQFVNILVDGFFLRRPISVCDYSECSLTIIYKTVGAGTLKMSETPCGEKFDILVGLGNGFDTKKSGDNPLLIGGGVGVPPMYRLAKELLAEGKNVSIILGFNTAEEVFYKEEFEKLGAKVYVTTADASMGIKGFVTEAMDIDYSYIYTCGPEPMLRAVYQKSKTSGQFSFEERMGCGFGACMGCSCKTLYGNKRICKDGPVLLKEEIIWPEQK